MSFRGRHSRYAIAAAAFVALANTSAHATLQVLENFTPAGTGADLAGYTAAQTSPETGLTGTWMNDSALYTGNAYRNGTILLSATTGENNNVALQYPTNSSLSSSNPTGGSALGSGGYPNPLYTANLSSGIPLSGAASTTYFSFLTDNYNGDGYNGDALLAFVGQNQQIYAGIGYNGKEDISVENTGNVPFGSGNSYNATGHSFAAGFSGGYMALAVGEIVTTPSGADTAYLSMYRYQGGGAVAIPINPSFDFNYNFTDTDTVNQIGVFIDGSPAPEISAIRVGTTYADAVGTVSPLPLNGTFTTYTGAVNGNFDSSTANFSLNGSSTAFSNGNTVLFDDTATGPHNVVVQSGGVSPAAVYFNNANTNYNFSGGAVTSPGTLNLASFGTITLNNSNTYAGGVNIANGTLVLNPGSLLSTSIFTVGQGVLSINGGTIQASNFRDNIDGRIRRCHRRHPGV